MRAETRVAECVLALAVVHDGQVDFLEDALIFALVTESVLAPSSDPTTVAGKVVVRLGQANGRDVRIVEINWRIDANQCDVVDEIAGEEFGMNDDLVHKALDVGIEFVFAVNVPLSKAHFQISGSISVE